jgi:hypothetical protein
MFKYPLVVWHASTWGVLGQRFPVRGQFAYYAIGDWAVFYWFFTRWLARRHVMGNPSDIDRLRDFISYVRKHRDSLQGFNDISVNDLRNQAAHMLVELTPVEADAIITLYRKALEVVDQDDDFDLTGEYGPYGYDD